MMATTAPILVTRSFVFLLLLLLFVFHCCSWWSGVVVVDAWVLPSSRTLAQQHRQQQQQQQQQQKPPSSGCSLLLFASSSANGGRPQESSSASAAASTTTTTAAITTTTTTGASMITTTSIVTNIQEHAVVLDGAEWISVRRHLRQLGLWPSTTDDTTTTNKLRSRKKMSSCAVLNLVTMRCQEQQQQPVMKIGVRVAAAAASADNNNNNIVVVPLNNEIFVYKNSMATIPAGISVQDAVRTFWCAWTAVQTVLPLQQNPGSSSSGATGPAAVANEEENNKSSSSGDGATNNNYNNMNAFHRVVIMGGNEHACMAARALAALDCQVTLVTATGKPSMPLSDDAKIHVLPPAAGDVGFCQVVNKFDALLDTIGCEWGDSDNDSDNDDYGSSLLSSSSRTSVIRLLETRHDCATYVSTRTFQEEILAKEGLLFGPGKAKNYEPATSSTSNNKVSSCYYDPPPPPQLGDTVQRLLQAGIVWPEKAVPSRMISLPNNNNNNKKASIRGWTLGAYWESTTWPRDANGNGNTRYGLPVLDDNTFIAPLLSAPAYQVEAPPMPFDRRLSSDDSEEEEEGYSASSSSSSSNYMLDIYGLRGLQQYVVQPKLDCVLFLSAPYCRTCRRLLPFYRRMARMIQEEEDSNKNNNNKKNRIVFGRADATGLAGKELGRHLNVDAVPTFCLFKNGELYGSPLAVSKLPDSKLELAMEYLKADKAWDEAVFKNMNDDDDNEKEQRTKLT